MNTFLAIVAIAVFYTTTNIVVKHYTGIKPDGWRLWVYDLPAYISGILAGYILF